MMNKELANELRSIVTTLAEARLNKHKAIMWEEECSRTLERFISNFPRIDEVTIANAPTKDY